MLGMGGGPQVTHGQEHLARRVARPAGEPVDVAANHHPDHLLMLDLGPGGDLAGVSAVAENHDPVGELLDLTEPVRDPDHAHPAALEILDDPK